MDKNTCPTPQRGKIRKTQVCEPFQFQKHKGEPFRQGLASWSCHNFINRSNDTNTTNINIIIMKLYLIFSATLALLSTAPGAVSATVAVSLHWHCFQFMFLPCGRSNDSSFSYWRLSYQSHLYVVHHSILSVNLNLKMMVELLIRPRMTQWSLPLNAGAAGLGLAAGPLDAGGFDSAEPAREQHAKADA